MLVRKPLACAKEEFTYVAKSNVEKTVKLNILATVRWEDTVSVESGATALAAARRNSGILRPRVSFDVKLICRANPRRDFPRDRV